MGIMAGRAGQGTGFLISAVAVKKRQCCGESFFGRRNVDRMRMIRNYFFFRRTLVTVTVNTKAPNTAFFLSEYFPAPQKRAAGIVNPVAAGAQTRLVGSLVFDVCSFRRHFAEIMLGFGNEIFGAMTLAADHGR